VADRFGWIGESRRRAALAWIDAQVHQWWSDWSALPAAATCSFDEGGIEGLLGDGSQVLRQSGSDLLLVAPGPAALAGAFVGVAADAPGSLARYIGDEAIEDLLHRLALGMHGEVSVPVDIEQVSRTLLEPRLGSVAISVAIGGLDLRIRLARRLVNQVQAPVRARTVSLTSRRAASGDARARLRGELDLGDIALVELRALKPGDVIVTHCHLETLPTLVIDGERGALVARAQLGEHRGHRALQLLVP